MYRLPIELLRKWVSEDSRLLDRSLTNTEEEQKPLFELAKYTVDIANIDLGIIVSKDSFSGRVSRCSASIEFNNNLNCITVLSNIFSLNIAFNNT